MKEINKNLYVEGSLSKTVQNIINYVHEKDGKRIGLVRYTIETNAGGHLPHNDWGDIRHMEWCKYSVSILTTLDYEGGEFSFVDDSDKIIETINKQDHYKNTLIYDVTHRHQVTPHHGGSRTVLLLFFKDLDEDDHTTCLEVNKLKFTDVELLSLGNYLR